MLYITKDEEKHYLAFRTYGELHLITEKDKNDIVSQGMRKHQELNELLFDILAVDASFVKVPYAPPTKITYAPPTENRESSGNGQLTP